MAELDVLTRNDDKDNGGQLMDDLLGNYLEETDQVNKFHHANDHDDDDEKNLTKELNIDDQAWQNYVDQHPQLPEVDIISCKCMCACSETLPVDLLFNETAHNRVKDLAKLAIKWYNDRHDTEFVTMHIVKANFNYHYTVDRYYITFIAKDDKSCVFNEFVGTVARKLSTGECFVVFCGERFRPKLPENPCSQHLLIDLTTGDEPLDQENVDKSGQIKALCEEDLLMSRKYMEKLEEFGLLLLDQPFYPEFVKDKVLPGQDPDDFTLEKRCIL